MSGKTAPEEKSGEEKRERRLLQRIRDVRVKIRDELLLLPKTLSILQCVCVVGGVYSCHCKNQVRLEFLKKKE